MSKKIIINVDSKTLEATLNETKTSDLFYSKLPLTLTMDRWGGEYYGDCGIDGVNSDKTKVEMEPGELAIWPQGMALCIFFDKTPASVDDKPRAISPVFPIGKIEGDLSFLKNMGHSIEVLIDKVE